MSWDAWVEIDTGNGETLAAGDLNYTHNCNEMMRRALDAVGELAPLGEHQLYALDGTSCAKAADILGRALHWWEQQPREFFKQFEPENGWGDADGAYRFWSAVKALCLKHPKATLRLCG